MVNTRVSSVFGSQPSVLLSVMKIAMLSENSDESVMITIGHCCMGGVHIDKRTVQQSTLPTSSKTSTTTATHGYDRDN
jgi:hypothetical protein